MGALHAAEERPCSGICDSHAGGGLKPSICRVRRRAWGFQRRPAQDPGSRHQWRRHVLPRRGLHAQAAGRAAPQDRAAACPSSGPLSAPAPDWPSRRAGPRLSSSELSAASALLCKMWEQREQQPLQPPRRSDRRPGPFPGSPRPAVRTLHAGGIPEAAQLTPPSLRARGPGSAAPGGTHNPTCHIVDFWRAEYKTRFCGSPPGLPTERLHFMPS